MAENSHISWTDDTFNPWEGCQKVGPGCDGCYAEARNIRYAEKGATVAPNWGPGAPRRRTSAANWRKPLKWDREQVALMTDALRDGMPKPPPRFVFCASLADVFDNAVPVEWRRDLFDLIRATPNLTWLLLTKRPGNILKMVGAMATGETGNWWPGNAAIGCTVVNQDEADRDIPKLLEARTVLVPAFTFLSMEPLLGPVDLMYPTTLWPNGPAMCCSGYECGCKGMPTDPPLVWGVDWVITGGETDQGQHNARPANPQWFRDIRDQCAQAGVAYHHKQNGEWRAPEPDETYDTSRGRGGKPPAFLISGDGTVHCFWETAGERAQAIVGVGKARAGRLLDGVEHNARPEVARG